jgi:hypothetical protein
MVIMTLQQIMLWRMQFVNAAADQSGILIGYDAG